MVFAIREYFYSLEKKDIVTNETISKVTSSFIFCHPGSSGILLKKRFPTSNVD